MFPAATVMICVRAADVLALFAESPEYSAVITWLPTSSVLMMHCACPAATGAATQPTMVVAASLKCIVPVGELPPVTAAVNVSTLPNCDGLADEASVVVVETTTALTTCVSTLEVLVALFASPPYAAVIE